VSRIKVLIADDQELFASGIEIMLKGPGKDDLSVVGIAANGREAVTMTARYRPDVVLMDVRMPEMDGVKATQIIHEKHPDAKILILTTFDDDRYVLDALNNGALGYILKNVSPEELIMSIKAVYNGSFLVSPSVGYRLVRQAEERTHAIEESEAKYQGQLNYLMSRFESLTTREAEIVHLLMLDFDNYEIAERLYLAEQTVKNRISSIYAKLGVTDRIHAKRYVNDILSKRGNSK
jgi:DNA-binding NarL/FixJ family response regulator